jgi:hypothetical protein
MLVYRSPDYFDIEHKSVGYALTVKQASDVAAVNFEAALSVRKLGRQFHNSYYKPVKKRRTDMSVMPLVFYEVRLG